jgi:mannose-1-phosphate guanylyltransferase
LTNSDAVDKNGNMAFETNNYAALIGKKDTIFVYIATANLIFKKELSQDVKNVYNALEKEQSAL